MTGIRQFQDSHERMPDGIILHCRKRESRSREAVLVLPHITESITGDFYAEIERSLPSDMAAWMIELRGHGISHGAYDLGKHRDDVRHWVTRLADHHRLFVIAVGMSASLVLQFEERANYLSASRRPPMPGGMILVSPTFEGGLPARLGSCKRPARSLAGELKEFILEPIRLQTPSRIFLPEKESIAHLRRLFGSCLARKVGWLHPEASSLEERAGVKDVVAALEELREEDEPIRFAL